MFPQEICNMVIDHLHDDPDSLRRCSLVCRAWVPSSSLHLFRCVVLPPRAGEGILHDTTPYNFTTRYATFRVSKHVRDLTLVGSKGFGAYRPTVRITPQEIILLLDELPHLQYLTLIRVQFDPKDVSPATDPFWDDRIGVRDIHALAIHDYSLRSAYLPMLLLHFRRISRLVLDNGNSKGLNRWREDDIRPTTHMIFVSLPFCLIVYLY